MEHLHAHPWDVDPTTAIAIQKQLAQHVIVADRFSPPRAVAGVDVGFEEQGTITRAAVAVLSYPQLELLDYHVARLPTRFPYIPGLLSFREIPAVLAALDQLQRTPDLLLCDGHGIAHPRRLGIASHLGVITGIPTIGAAKSRLVGRHAALAAAKGSWMPLTDRGDTIGAALRTREGCKPLFVSPGHRVSLPSAIALVLACCPRYRLPETTRWADGIASRRAWCMRRLAL